MSRATTNYQKGLWAEFVAGVYLRLKGYAVLQQRYKTAFGEIDILARKQNCVVAVEVKARGNHGEAAEAVTPRTQGRIEKAMAHYLSHNPAMGDQDVRFDVITIKLPFFVRHIDNAWRPRA